jgi:3',5'-nucleoside bisphosphate phosphatase
MRLDLHLHTLASDGAWSPERVVRQARAGGLDVVSITDHDTTAGLDEAHAVAREVGIELIAGCELSSTHEGRDVHVLGYGVDPDAPVLVRYQARAGGRRRERMAEMVERLARLGISVSLDRVLEVAGDRGVVGRPHLARVLVEDGHARDLPDAFDRYIGDTQPAFVATALHTPADVIEVIREAGGVPVWAHPASDQLEALLPALVEAGLEGLEAYRPWHTPGQTRRILDRAAGAGLVVSGGSDWHDPDRNSPLGAFHVLDRQVQALLELLDRGAG